MTPTRRRGSPRALLLAVAVLLGLAAGWWASSQGRGPTRGPAPPSPVEVVVQPPARPSPAPSQAPQASPPLSGEARVAIVFDDAGGSLSHVEEIISIGRPVAVAVLPGLAHSTEVARRARAAGMEVLLHLPVEPVDSSKALGPGGVTVTMDDAQIRSAVRDGLASVPGAAGLNNHMGSRGTADRRVVRAILEVARERGLYFLDSVTTPASLVPEVGREMGVRTAVRTVFLDNDDEPDAIRRQIRALLAAARERGEAVGIGHAQRRTARVLAAMLEEFDREGVVIVPPSALVR